MEWSTICDRAKILPDAPPVYDDQFMVRRYRKYYGKRIKADTVRRAREAFLEKMGTAPGIASFRINLEGY